MFVKFTRLDNSPIWLNASFIVTVEPRRGGGSVVVPVGDGLDYDVRESPEAVLAILGEAPAPVIVPVPTTDALVKKPVSDCPEASAPTEAMFSDESSVAPVAPAKKPAKKTTRKKKAAVAEPAPEAPAEPAPDAQPSDPPTLQPSTPPTALVLTEGEIERLRKLAPRTLRKLGNTLKTQFKFEDPEVGVQDLLSRGFILVNEQRVHWL